MRKITRAMQMVSAAKMRKAQNAVVSSRTYADLAWELVQNVSGVIPVTEPGSTNSMDSGTFSDPLLASGMTQLLSTYPKAKKIGVVILGSNGGLVGSLNSNLANKLRELTVIDPSNKSYTTNHEVILPFDSAALHSGRNHEVIVEAIVYGKKAKSVAQRMKKSILADFQKNDKTITTQDVFPLAKYITDAYTSGEYQKIVLVYNNFVSTLVQKPTIKQLLPFINTTLSVPSQTSHLKPTTDFLFEPSPSEVLEHLIPRIVESQIYEAILESNASEHSARMVMMKNATEAAGDLIDDLSLTYNQLRQGKITTELAEITAGRIALE